MPGVEQSIIMQHVPANGHPQIGPIERAGE